MVASSYVYSIPRKAYPSDISDDEWEFVAPYLALMSLDALQRKHDLRAVFNAARYLAHTGAPWRYLPGGFPPWPAVYQQTRRRLAAGCFEALVHDLRLLLRVLQRRQPQPSAAILDTRVLQSSPKSGARAGYSGHKRRKGSKVHAAADTLGHLLALAVTPASTDERTQVGALAEEVQAVTGHHVEVAFADQGYTGKEPAAAAAAQGIQLEVVWRSSACPRPNAASCSCPNAGSLKEPNLNTYNPRLTSKPAAPMIGFTGLLNLLTVVSRLQAAQQDGARAPQEAGVPCLVSAPNQSIWPALPPPARAVSSSRWDQLPPANRHRLPRLLGRLVERQLTQPAPLLPVGREEATHDLHR